MPVMHFGVHCMLKRKEKLVGVERAVIFRQLLSLNGTTDHDRYRSSQRKLILCKRGFSTAVHNEGRDLLESVANPAAKGRGAHLPSVLLPLFFILHGVIHWSWGGIPPLPRPLNPPLAGMFLSGVFMSKHRQSFRYLHVESSRTNNICRIIYHLTLLIRNFVTYKLIFMRRVKKRGNNRRK